MSEEIRGTKMPYECLAFNFETLMNDFLGLQTQIDRELKDNNGLREVIMIYSKAFEKVEEYHKDCSTCDNCDLDGLKDISKKLHEAIMKP